MIVRNPERKLALLERVSIRNDVVGGANERVGKGTEVRGRAGTEGRGEDFDDGGGAGDVGGRGVEVGRAVGDDEESEVVMRGRVGFFGVEGGGGSRRNDRVQSVKEDTTVTLLWETFKLDDVVLLRLEVEEAERVGLRGGNVESTLTVEVEHGRSPDGAQLERGAGAEEGEEARMGERGEWSAKRKKRGRGRNEKRQRLGTRTRGRKRAQVGYTSSLVNPSVLARFQPLDRLTPIDIRRRMKLPRRVKAKDFETRLDECGEDSKDGENAEEELVEESHDGGGRGLRLESVRLATVA